ncbi:MAG: PHP domain-containing protein [Rhodothermia bacterium]|nr:MAG: PHP domain-containing protein [Rhodothermia bacterium]
MHVRADFHLHTHYSDGRYSPEQVVQKAAEAGLEGLAITDHDTVSGIAEARTACLRANIRFFCGVEISTAISGNEIHLLAYEFDPEDEFLLELFKSQRERRHQRGLEFLRALRTGGIDIPPADELSLGHGSVVGTVGRPHIARLIVKSGAAASMDDAFAEYLVPGSPTFVPKSFPGIGEVLKLVQEAGGVSILAHPGHMTSHSDILRLIDLGLDGVEVVHPHMMKCFRSTMAIWQAGTS